MSDFKKIEGISDTLARNIIERRNEKKLASEIENILSKGIKIISIDDKSYPEKLKQIYDPPYVLYVRGNMEKYEKNVAVVGSRRCTMYGRNAAKKLSFMLSKYNIGVISGMARGIDTQAHMGAIENGGYTCAVLGCGCDIVYPPENKKLMDEIIEHGSVVSEYPPGVMPLSGNFPARNRIISGMSDGVLVVEAGEKSGALITADFALEQGRDVYAIPGSIFSNMSKGTNFLIKQGAKPVTDICDILEELGVDYQVQNNDNITCQLTAKEKILMDNIECSPLYIDDLAKRCSLKINEINSLLTMLELKGLVKIIPGRYVCKFS
ncbi:MAG: DNA-processing protein DprA [Clostridiales bacterium]|nr:DNA-processing protein DprA [Clostridiales bacterium]